MKIKRLTVLIVLLIVSAAFVFGMEEKQTNTFRVKWSKVVEGSSTMKIMSYDGTTALTGVNNITSTEIELDPEDSVTPVPAFMIRYTTNIRADHTISISATKFKADESDPGFGYTMVFTPESFNPLVVDADGSNTDLVFFVNSLNGFVDTDIKVDIVFTEYDSMEGDTFSSVVTISCCAE